MKRLGYTWYVSQGGDHGSVISDILARHLTMPATAPSDVVTAISNGGPAPAGLSAP
jgi:D-arabinose 5-phosphate isomerase GutQ